MATQVCRNFIVSGIVQGVGFRAATLREARRIGGLLGWVQNVSNGEVEVLAQGAEENVKALFIWCHKGPPAAAVDNVIVRNVPLQDGLTEFHIK